MHVISGLFHGDFWTCQSLLAKRQDDLAKSGELSPRQEHGLGVNALLLRLLIDKFLISHTHSFATVQGKFVFTTWLKEIRMKSFFF